MYRQTAFKQTEGFASLKTQLDESGESRLEACVVICGYFVLDVILATVLVVVVRIGTAHQSSSEYVVVWTRTVECVPVTYGRRVGARTKKIFIAWDPALIEGLSWFLDAPFFSNSFPSNYPFWRDRFPMPNEYQVWRPVIAIGKKLKVCSLSWCKSCTAVENNAVKEGTANRCGMSMDWDWWKATGPDFQTNKMSANCHLGYNNLSSGESEEDLGKWKMTPKILVQNHTKSTLRPSRILIHCNTVKYSETLYAIPERGVCDYPPRVAKKLSYLMLILTTYVVQWRKLSSRVFSVILVLTCVRWQ